MDNYEEKTTLESVSAKEQTIVCQKCGTVLTEEQKFCPNCGTAASSQIEDATITEKSSASKENKATAKSNLIYFIGAIVGVVLIILIICLCNIKKNRNSQIDKELSTNSESITETDSLSEEDIIVSTEYELIGRNCSEFLSEYEQSGGSVTDGLDSTSVMIGKSDYERRAAWEDWLKGFFYYLPNDCQIYYLENARDDYLSVLLFAENDVITSYYVYFEFDDFRNMSQYINETEFAEIKALDVSPTIKKMLGTDKYGDNWDDSLVCRPVFQKDEYSVQFQAEKFDPYTGDVITDWEEMWIVGFYVASAESPFQEVDSNSVMYYDFTAAARDMMAQCLRGELYHDTDCDLQIFSFVFEDECMVQFSQLDEIKASECVGVNGNSYYFVSGADNNNYRIDVSGETMLVYKANSFGEYRLCGHFGETEETMRMKTAKDAALQFFKRNEGVYLMDGLPGVVMITSVADVEGNENYWLEGTRFERLRDFYCTMVENGNVYYFETDEGCYKIVESKDIEIYRGKSKKDCNTICARLCQKLEMPPIDPYMVSGRYTNQNSGTEFSISMYSDFDYTNVEPSEIYLYDEVGNINIDGVSGLLYLGEDAKSFYAYLDNDEMFDFIVYEKDGDTLFQILEEGKYAGTYVMVEHYES